MPAASAIKMMTRLFADNCEDFISHHGLIGGKRYIDLTTNGIKIQKSLAKQHMPCPEEQLHELGSAYVAYEADEEAMRREFELLQSMGCDDITWLDQKQLLELKGSSSDFFCGIWFDSDSIIDSSAYARALLGAGVESGVLKLYENAPIKSTATIDGSAIVTLMDGKTIKAKHCVLATGGLFCPPELAGVLSPAYSYLVHVTPPPPSPSCPLIENKEHFAPQFSPNFFTLGYTHDWSWTNGGIRCSGEDHYSALKPPRAAQRCQSLTKWTREKYPNIWAPPSSSHDTETVPEQYGVYSETPDSVPIIGHANETSKVCYLLGCNAWGQAVLSGIAAIIPALLGYREMSIEEKESMRLVSIRRFSLLPIVQGK